MTELKETMYTVPKARVYEIIPATIIAASGDNLTDTEGSHEPISEEDL